MTPRVLKADVEIPLNLGYSPESIWHLETLHIYKRKAVSRGVVPSQSARRALYNPGKLVVLVEV